MKERSEEIPCWWHVTTQIWVVLLIGWSKFSAIQRHCFIKRPAILKPGVSELLEDFLFVLRETNRLESRLSGKSTDPRICDWRSGGKRKILAFVVIFCRVLRMTGTLWGAIQTPTSTALMGELGQGKLCWTVTTIPPLAGDWHGRIPDDSGNMLRHPPGLVCLNYPARC